MNIKNILLTALKVFLSAWIQFAYCALLVGVVLSFKYDQLLCITLSAVLVIALTIQTVRLVYSIKQDKFDRKQLIKDNQSYYAFMIVAYVVSLVVVLRLSFFTYKVPLETFKTSWDVVLAAEGTYDEYDEYDESSFPLPAERVWVMSTMIPGDIQYRLHEYCTITANLAVYQSMIQNLVLSNTNDMNEYFRLKQEANDYISGISLPEINKKLNLSISVMWLVTGLFVYCLKNPEIYLSRRSNKSEDVQ